MTSRDQEIVVTPPGVRERALADVNDPIVQQVLAAIEADLGRPLTVIERIAVTFAVGDRVPEGEIFPTTMSGEPTDAMRRLTEEVQTFALNPSVIAATRMNLARGREAQPVVAVEPQPTVGEQVATEQGLPPEALRSLPPGARDAEFIIDPLSGLPAVQLETGQWVAWNEAAQGWEPALGPLQDDEGPLPIGAEFFGITSPGDQIPTNIGEVEARFATDVADYVRESNLEADALGLGASYQAPGVAPVFGQSGQFGADDFEFGTPEYYPGDQWIDFATKGPEYQTQVQQALASAGLMRASDIAEGVWTIDAAKGMELAMLEANSSGGAKSWVEVLEDRAAGLEAAGNASGGGGGRRARRSPLAGRVLTIPAYVEPDYAALEGQVKDLFARQLNRRPSDWELALLAENLNENYRDSYDVQVEALKAEFEAGNRGILAGGPSIQSSGEVTGVDPVARLRQRIEERYAPEIGLNEDRARQRQDVSNVFSILTQTQQVLSGGAQ